MTGEIIIFAGRRYRIVYVAQGPYVRADGKGEVQGVRFATLVPI